MLPRAERLTRSSLFQRTHAGKKSVTVPPVSLFVLERQPKSAPKLPFVGFVIGKKEQGKATQRNRAKRRVREAYRLFRLSADDHTLSNLKQWYSLVFHIRTEATEAPFEEIRKATEECLALAFQKYAPKRGTSRAKADV